MAGASHLSATNKYSRHPLHFFAATRTLPSAVRLRAVFPQEVTVHGRPHPRVPGPPCFWWVLEAESSPLDDIKLIVQGENERLEPCFWSRLSASPSRPTPSRSGYWQEAPLTGPPPGRALTGGLPCHRGGPLNGVALTTGFEGLRCSLVGPSRGPGGSCVDLLVSG
jgi:hypothetical protein